MSEQTWTLALERSASKDRTMPTVPGQNAGRLNCEMGTGHLRTDQSKTMSAATAFRSTSSKRGGVKPTGGRISELYVPRTIDGMPDGSDYFAEWEAETLNGMIDYPACKTKRQDDLKLVCEMVNAGVEVPAEAIEQAQALIETMVRTDHDHGMAWRLEAGKVGLYA